MKPPKKDKVSAEQQFTQTERRPSKRKKKGKENFYPCNPWQVMAAVLSLGFSAFGNHPVRGTVGEAEVFLHSSHREPIAQSIACVFR